MPNAEGRMETLERVQDWWQRLAMSARPVCLDGDDVRVIAAESANALAAARAENERLRADLRLIASAYDDSLSVGEMSMRSYDMACVARRALAAQEGTNG